MITKYLAILRPKWPGKAEGGWVAGRAAYLHLPALRFYIRVGVLP